MQGDMKLFKAICKKAGAVYYHPTPTYSYKDIIQGIRITPNGKEMAAVEDNTFKTFGYFNDDMFAAKRCYREYFVTQKEQILQGLKNIDDPQALDIFEDHIFEQILSLLSQNIKDKSKVNSYNRVRKPIDLYIVGIAAMAVEMKDHRARLIKHLFLPLDSWMFQEPQVFKDESVLNLNKVTRKSKMGNVTTKTCYANLQAYLTERAEVIEKTIGDKFHRIYFDYFWRNRYEKSGENLFLTNL